MHQVNAKFVLKEGQQLVTPSDGYIECPHLGISLRVLLGAAAEGKRKNGMKSWPVHFEGREIATLHLR